jgi:hypothetical protein
MWEKADIVRKRNVEPQRINIIIDEDRIKIQNGKTTNLNNIYFLCIVLLNIF